MGKIRELAEKVGKWLDSWLFFGIAAEEDAKTHYIKCEKEFYQDVEEGYKPFEVRKNDRDYRGGRRYSTKGVRQRLRSTHRGENRG